MRVSVVYAYMSGALTNLSSGTVLPPCCRTNVDLAERFGNTVKLAKSDLDLIDAEQKKHYERIHEQVCKPLSVDLYLPHLHSDPEHNSDIIPETVYLVDRLMVTSSKFVIACLDLPSLGVGQEIEIALQTGIPVIAYKHARTRVSRMPLGSPILCDDVYGALSAEEDSERVIEYESEEELFQKLKKRIRSLLQYLDKATRPPRSREEFPERLIYLIEQNGDSAIQGQLAQKLGVPPAFVTFIQKTQRRLQEHFESTMPSMCARLQKLSQRYDFDRFASPSLTMLRQIAHALNLTVSELVGEETGMSERDSRIFELCKNHHNATLREFDLIRSGIPTGLAFSKLDEYVANKIKDLRRS